MIPGGMSPEPIHDSHSIRSVIAFQLALAIMKGILYYPLAFLTGLRAPPNVIDGLDSIAVFADDDE